MYIFRAVCTNGMLLYHIPKKNKDFSPFELFPSILSKLVGSAVFLVVGYLTGPLLHLQQRGANIISMTTVLHFTYKDIFLVGNFTRKLASCTFTLVTSSQTNNYLHKLDQLA